MFIILAMQLLNWKYLIERNEWTLIVCIIYWDSFERISKSSTYLVVCVVLYTWLEMRKSIRKSMCKEFFFILKYYCSDSFFISAIWVHDVQVGTDAVLLCVVCVVTLLSLAKFKHYLICCNYPYRDSKTARIIATYIFHANLEYCNCLCWSFSNYQIRQL